MIERRHPSHPLRYIAVLCEGYQVRIPRRAGGPDSRFFGGLSDDSLFAALCYRDLVFLSEDKLVHATKQVVRTGRKLPVGISLAIGRPSKNSNKPTKDAYVAYWSQRDKTGRSMQLRKRFSFRELGAKGAYLAAVEFRRDMVLKSGAQFMNQSAVVKH